MFRRVVVEGQQRVAVLDQLGRRLVPFHTVCFDEKIEGDVGGADAYAASIAETLKLRAQIEVVAIGTLPKDGVIIEDQRSYD